MGNHNQLLGAVPLHQSLRRNDFNPRDHRIVIVAVRHALFNPAIHHSVGWRIGINSLTTAVRYTARRLAQQQASLGSCREDAPSAAFLDQELVILAGLKTQQREAKTVLPA